MQIYVIYNSSLISTGYSCLLIHCTVKVHEFSCFEGNKMRVLCVSGFSLIFSYSRAQRDLYWIADKSHAGVYTWLYFLIQEQMCVSCTVEQGWRYSHASREMKQWKPRERDASLSRHRRRGRLTCRWWALCIDYWLIKRNPILNSEENVSFNVTSTFALTWAGLGFQTM